MCSAGRIVDFPKMGDGDPKIRNTIIGNHPKLLDNQWEKLSMVWIKSMLPINPLENSSMLLSMEKSLVWGTHILGNPWTLPFWHPKFFCRSVDRMPDQTSWQRGGKVFKPRQVITIYGEIVKSYIFSHEFNTIVAGTNPNFWLPKWCELQTIFKRLKNIISLLVRKHHQIAGQITCLFFRIKNHQCLFPDFAPDVGWVFFNQEKPLTPPRSHRAPAAKARAHRKCGTSVDKLGMTGGAQ